eukprot:3227357-Rhodomonas_salina.1
MPLPRHGQGGCSKFKSPDRCSIFKSPHRTCQQLLPKSLRTLSEPSPQARADSQQLPVPERGGRREAGTLSLVGSFLEGVHAKMAERPWVR